MHNSQLLYVQKKIFKTLKITGEQIKLAQKLR